MSTCKIWCQMRETKTKRGEPASIILEVAVKETDFKIEDEHLWRVYGYLDSTRFNSEHFLESIRPWVHNWNVTGRSARLTLKRGITFEVPNLTEETPRGEASLWKDLDVGGYSVSFTMNRKRPFHPDYHIAVKKWDGYETLVVVCHQSDYPQIYYFQLNSNGGQRAIDLGLLRDLLRPFTAGERGMERKLAREEGIVVTIPQDDMPRLIERIKEAVDWDEFLESSQKTAEKTTTDTKIDDKTEQVQ